MLGGISSTLVQCVPRGYVYGNGNTKKETVEDYTGTAIIYYYTKYVVRQCSVESIELCLQCRSSLLYLHIMLYLHCRNYS